MSTAPRKPRKEAKLKTFLRTIHPQAQFRLWEYLQSHGQEETVAWVETEFGVKTSAGALSNFWHWYPFRNKLEQANELKTQLRDTLRDMPDLNLSDDQISQAGQLAFENQAIRAQDSKLFLELRRLRQKDQEQLIASRRMKLLEEQAAKAKEALGDSKLSAAEQASRLREIFKKE